MGIQARAALLALALAAPALGCGGDEAETSAARAPGAPLVAPSRAARHLPEGCEAVVHYASTGAAATSPGAAALRALLPGGGDDQIAIAQLRALGGFDPARDVDSALVCLTQGGAQQVMVAAGDIALGAVLPPLEAEIPGAERRRIGEVEAMVLTVDERRWIIGQAADGAIVVASSEVLFAAALPESTRAAELGMHFDAPLSVHAGRAVLERIAASQVGVVAGDDGDGGRSPFAALLAGAVGLDMSGGAAASLRVEYESAERAAAVAPALRDLVDRRTDESTRVQARVAGSRVILDVDGMHFVREVFQ